MPRASADRDGLITMLQKLFEPINCDAGLANNVQSARIHSQHADTSSTSLHASVLCTRIRLILCHYNYRNHYYYLLYIIEKHNKWNTWKLTSSRLSLSLQTEK